MRDNKFKEFLGEKEIRLEYICTDSPGSNGSIERVGFTLSDGIRCELYDRAYNCAWTTVADEVIARYNNSAHSTTGYAPNFLMNGVVREETVVDAENEKPDLEKAREEAVKRTIKAHVRNAFYFNRNRRDVELREGQVVYCKLASKVNRENYKEIFEGPFEIKRLLSRNRFEIEKDGVKKIVNKVNLRLIL